MSKWKPGDPIVCRFCGGTNCEHGDDCRDCGCPKCGWPGARYENRGWCGDCGWEIMEGAYDAWMALHPPHPQGIEHIRALWGFDADIVGKPIIETRKKDE